MSGNPKQFSEETIDIIESNSSRFGKSILFGAFVGYFSKHIASYPLAPFPYSLGLTFADDILETGSRGLKKAIMDDAGTVLGLGLGLGIAYFY